jgi:lipopolysaccharide export system protein LptC
MYRAQMRMPTNMIPTVDATKEDILKEQAVAIVRQQFALRPNEMVVAEKTETRP